MSNPWDALSSTFDTKKDEGEISSHAADNILIAWPVVLDFIKENVPKGEALRLLEYGCGGGGFAEKLNFLGYQVTGVDSSVEMIKVANAAHGSHIKFVSGDSSVLHTFEQFSIITSIMTLQFIEDIEKVVDDFSKALTPGGILVFAVHNPEHVKEYLQAKILFEDFDSDEQPKSGYLKLGGNKIPIFIRTAEEYNRLLKSKGFEPLLEEYPPFTEEFLTKYPISAPTNQSEFLILGYRNH